MKQMKADKKTAAQENKLVAQESVNGCAGKIFFCAGNSKRQRREKNQRKSALSASSAF